MKAFIENLLPRLKQFSSSLERQEVFVDAPWVVIDEEQNQQKYIFRRNGDLIMSLNGQVTIGKWEYLESAQSLLIVRIQDKILLNQKFVHPAVMILKRDGIGSDYMVLGNENLIPGLNIESYLSNLSNEKPHFRSISTNQKPLPTFLELENGEILELLDFNGKYGSTEVMIGGRPATDGIVKIQGTGQKLDIAHGMVFRVLADRDYHTDKGVLQIEVTENGDFYTGDRVFQKGGPAPNGKYKLGFLSTIRVKDGRII